jgi:hypothetical protein
MHMAWNITPALSRLHKGQKLIKAVLMHSANPLCANKTANNALNQIANRWRGKFVVNWPASGLNVTHRERGISLTLLIPSRRALSFQYLHDVSFSGGCALGMMRHTHSAIDTPVCIIRVIETAAGRGRAAANGRLDICALDSLSSARDNYLHNAPGCGEQLFHFHNCARAQRRRNALIALALHFNGARRLIAPADTSANSAASPVRIAL